MKKHLLALWLFGSLVLVGGLWAQNAYYDHGTFPQPGSAGSSAAMRAELDLIEAGFAKLPTLSGNANKAVIINGSGTAMTTTTGTLTLPGNFALSGANALTLTTTASTNVTLPTTGTLATLAGSESLSNKTLVAPTFSGSYTLGGTPTVSSALNLTSGQITFPASQNASANANTLDDYEEGVWTPSVGGTATYTTQAGYYTKIGRMVCIHGTLVITSIGTGSQTTISGLPFTTANTTFQPLTVAKTASLALSVTAIQAVTGVSGTDFFLYSRTAAATADAINNVLGNSSEVSVNGCYQATA